MKFFLRTKSLLYPILVALALVTGSCATNKVWVKFKNESPEEFRQLHVNINGKEFDFPDLKSGKTTKYVLVDNTYGYCPVKIITATDTLSYFVIDYVGERLYTSGKLMMKINILRPAGRLQIDSKRPWF